MQHRRLPPKIPWFCSLDEGNKFQVDLLIDILCGSTSPASSSAAAFAVVMFNCCLCTWFLF